MNRLSEAILLAVEAHGDTLDKAGRPYILHPLAVMLDPSLTTEDEQIVAVLHDTLEDTNITEKDILDKFGFTILNGVQSVSRAFFVGQNIFYKEPAINVSYVKEKYK